MTALLASPRRGSAAPFRYRRRRMCTADVSDHRLCHDRAPKHPVLCVACECRPGATSPRSLGPSSRTSGRHHSREGSRGAYASRGATAGPPATCGPLLILYSVYPRITYNSSGEPLVYVTGASLHHLLWSASCRYPLIPHHYHYYHRYPIFHYCDYHYYHYRDCGTDRRALV